MMLYQAMRRVEGAHRAREASERAIDACRRAEGLTVACRLPADVRTLVDAFQARQGLPSTKSAIVALVILGLEGA